MKKEITDAADFLKMIGQIYLEDFNKGCSAYTRQADPATGKTQDICMRDETRCPFYDGQFQAHVSMMPESKLDLPIAEGAQLGFCRLQRDALRIGPFILFDKRILR